MFAMHNKDWNKFAIKKPTFLVSSHIYRHVFRAHLVSSFSYTVLWFFPLLLFASALTRSVLVTKFSLKSYFLKAIELPGNKELPKNILYGNFEKSICKRIFIDLLTKKGAYQDKEWLFIFLEVFCKVIFRTYNSIG